jgi:hypothetical protein
VAIQLDVKLSACGLGSFVTAFLAMTLLGHSIFYIAVESVLIWSVIPRPASRAVVIQLDGFVAHWCELLAMTK